MNIHFLSNPTQRVASNKRLPTAELETLVLYGAPSVRARILKKASANCHVLAANPNTYHVVEALVRVSDPAALAELVFEVRRHVPALAQSRHGNVVIQELLRRVPAVVRNDLTESILEQSYALATGEFGNRVIQALLVPSSAAVHIGSDSKNHDDTAVASYYAGDDTSSSSYNEQLSATVADKIYTVLVPRFEGLATNEYGQAVVASVVTNEHRKVLKVQEDSRSSNSNIADFMREQYVQQLLDNAEPNPFVSALRSNSAQLLPMLWNGRAVNDDDEDEDVDDDAALDSEGKSKKKRVTGRIHLLCAMIRASSTLFAKSGPLKRFVKEMVIEQALLGKNRKSQKAPDATAAATAVDEEKEKAMREAAEHFIADRAAVFIAICEARPADWGVAVLDAIIALDDADSRQQQQQQQSRLLSWSKKEHLATIVEALLRHVVPKLPAAGAQQSLLNKVKSIFSTETLLELVTDRYGGVVARELARSLPPTAAALQPTVVRCAALSTQASYSLFFQALLTADGTPASTKAAIVRGIQAALLQGSGSNAWRRLINDPAVSRLVQCILDCPSCRTSEFVRAVYDCVAANIGDKNEDSDNDCDEKQGAADEAVEIGGNNDSDEDEGEADKDKAAAVAAAAAAAAPEKGPVFARIASSPNGSHVVQSLLRAVDDRQLEALAGFASSKRCVLQGKFRGLPALARNKYGCHVVCVLLQQLKARSASNEPMLLLCRSSMNLLKPHVHFLALAASTGRRVFEVMCKTGSAELKLLMRDVVALKCETYLRGDPFLEGDDDDSGAAASAASGDGDGAKKRSASSSSKFNQRTHHLEKKKTQQKQDIEKRRARSATSK